MPTFLLSEGPVEAGPDVETWIRCHGQQELSQATTKRSGEVHHHRGQASNIMVKGAQCGITCLAQEGHTFLREAFGALAPMMSGIIFGHESEALVSYINPTTL